jgi:hypothetical protein
VSFCSRLAQERREPMAGTAVVGRAFLFLPVAKAFWRDGELNDSWAAPSEIAACRAARKHGVVTRLYNPPKSGQEVILTCIGPGEAPAILDELLSVFAPRWGPPAPAAQRFAICTHGTRDRCCAKWGFAAFREADRLYQEGRSPFQALESSHLGGDRFAATGIVFPSGGMYAHLDSRPLEALTTAEAAGRILPEGFRGQVFERPWAQVVRAGLASEGLWNEAAEPLVAQEPTGAGELEVRAGSARFGVTLGQAEVTFVGSCGHLEAGRRSRAVRWTYGGARAF